MASAAFGDFLYGPIRLQLTLHGLQASNNARQWSDRRITDNLVLLSAIRVNTSSGHDVAAHALDLAGAAVQLKLAHLTHVTGEVHLCSKLGTPSGPHGVRLWDSVTLAPSLPILGIN